MLENTKRKPSQKPKFLTYGEPHQPTPKHEAVFHIGSSSTTILGVKLLLCHTFTVISTAKQNRSVIKTARNIYIKYDWLKARLHAPHNKQHKRKCFFVVFLSVYIVYLTVCVCVSALAAKERRGRGLLQWSGGVFVFLREQHDDTALCPTDDDWAFSPTASCLLWARLDSEWHASLLLSLRPGNLSLDPRGETPNKSFMRRT